MYNFVPDGGSCTLHLNFVLRIAKHSTLEYTLWAPSNQKRSGDPVSFTDLEKQELIAFVTEIEEPDASPREKPLRKSAMHAHQRLLREWRSPWDTTSAYPGESSTRHRTVDPVESGGPRSTSHGHEDEKRVLWTDESPSPLQALANDPGLSDRQKRNMLTASTKSPARAGRARWFGVDLVGHQI